MSQVLKTLDQLQTNLFMQFDKPKIKTPDIVEFGFGPSFASQYQPHNGDDDSLIDVPNVNAVDSPYLTHVDTPVPRGKKAGSNYLPYENESSIYEQDDEEKEGAPVEGSEAMPAGQDPGVGSDMSQDPSMGGDLSGGMGGFGQPEIKTAGEIGRIYELKKIYSRLTSIESYLSNESSRDAMEIRSKVSQAIELFEILSSNFESYKDKLDDIIVLYYKFIIEVYESVRNFYKQLSK